MSDMVTITTPPCPVCSSQDSIEVSVEDLAKYNAGEFVQDAFPHMPSDIRERFISGVCGECWGVLFQEESYGC